MNASIRVISLFLLSAVVTLLLYPINFDSTGTYILLSISVIINLAILFFYPFYRNKYVLFAVIGIILVFNPLNVFFIRGNYPQFINIIIAYLNFILAVVVSETEKREV